MSQNFHKSVENIRVEDGHWLVADINGQERRLDLNLVLGNNDGRFSWEGQNFSETAQDINFNMDERWDEDGNPAPIPVLRASLATVDGEWRNADVNLAEMIWQRDGIMWVDYRPIEESGQEPM